MTWIRNLSVARKIYLLVALGLVGIVSVGASGLWATRSLSRSTVDVGRTQLPAVRSMTLCDMMHDGMLACVYRALLIAHDGDAKGMAAAVEETAEFSENFRGYIGALDELEIAAETRAAVERARPDVEEYITGCSTLVQLCAEGKPEEAEARLPEVQAVFDRLETSLGELGERIEQDADAAVDASERVASLAGAIALGCLVTCAALALALGLYVAKLIVKPLDTAVAVLESGDIVALSGVDTDDEIGRMAQAVTATVRRMEESATELSAQKRTIEISAAQMERTAREAEEAAQRAQTLAAEAARVAAMVENSPACMMYADESLRISHMNPAARSALARLGGDYMPERLSGQPLARFFRDARASAGFIGNESNLPLHVQTELSGETLELALSAIHDDAGRRSGTLVSWEIVTEKLASERRARELQERELRSAQELQSKVERMLLSVDAISRGDLTVSIDVRGDDAIGRMGEALARLLTDMRGSMQRIRNSAEALARSSEALGEVSQKMSSEAQQTASQVHVVADAASKVSGSMRTVTESTDGMNQSIGEIARSASAAAKVARTAVQTADETNATVSDLDRSSEEIGKILKTIHTIAQQTNLLALNATIEAARAGEAGRGFAVVANEVKELAKETAKATTDISAKVAAIQSGSRGAVEAISRIGTIIREIDNLQTTIAAAVEEQTAMTRDISQNLSGATSSSAAITANMEQVATAAKGTSKGASHSLDVSNEVSRMSEDLLAAVGHFRL
jgi:methyl-accepting chemotaxis protein